jgi:hypothetical protein
MLERGMSTVPDFSKLADRQLLLEVKAAADQESRVTCRLIALLAEVDARRLYLGEGCSSLFTYCTRVLRLSEQAAYGRIEAARAARKYPLILERLADRSITLTTVTLLAPHLTEENCLEILDAARDQSKREIERLVARLAPQADLVTSVRKLPVQSTAQSELATVNTPVDVVAMAVPPPPPPRAALVAPLAPERFKVQMTIGRETHDKLRRVQDLLRHAIPNGDVAAVFDRALTVLLADLERAKIAATTRPRAGRAPKSGSRHIPAGVRRDVWRRDGGQCAFVGAEGRCTERGFLEFHHIEPHAAGGSTEVHNIQLRCRAHNVYEAELYFGARWPLLAKEARARYLGTRSGPS